MGQLYTDMDAPLRRHRSPITDAFEMMGSAPDIYNAAEGKTFHGLSQGYADLARAKLYGAQAENQALRTQGLQEMYSKHPIWAPPAQQQAGGQQKTVAATADGQDSQSHLVGDEFTTPYKNPIDSAFLGLSDTLKATPLALRQAIDSNPSKTQNEILSLFHPDFESGMPRGVGSQSLDVPERYDFISQNLSEITRGKAPQSAMPAQNISAPAERFNPSNPDHLFPYLLRVDEPRKLQDAVSRGFITGQQAILMDRVNNLQLSDVDKVSAKMQIMGSKSLDLYDTSGEIRGRSEDARAGRFQTESVNDLANAQKQYEEAMRLRQLTPHEIETEKAKAGNFRATAGQHKAQGEYYGTKADSLGKGGMSDKDYAKAVEEEAKWLRKGNLLRKGGPVQDAQIMAEAKRNVDQLIDDRVQRRGQGSTENAIEPPAGAVELLRKTPNTSIAFDAKYGAGMARKYLEDR